MSYRVNTKTRPRKGSHRLAGYTINSCHYWTYFTQLNERICRNYAVTLT